MKTSVALLAVCLLFCYGTQATTIRGPPARPSHTSYGGPYIPPHKPLPPSYSFEYRMHQLESRVARSEQLINQLLRAPYANRVAFGASLGNVGSIGPYNTEITLTYKSVFTNTGAYNSGTGIFTAPVRGMYYFSFSGHNVSSKPMGLRLMRNGRQIATVYNHASGNRYETATNGMVVYLSARDQVYMRLRQDTWVFDNVNNHSTFIGFLLYPM